MMVNLEVCMWIRQRVTLQKLEVYLILNDNKLLVIQLAQIAQINYFTRNKISELFSYVLF
jgi:hypothetical protein